MSRLGPQAKKLFEVGEKKKGGKSLGKEEKSKKYTFILPVELMKKVKHRAVEEEKTISEWLKEAIQKHLSD